MATPRRDFTQEEIDYAWEKAIRQPNNDPNVFRKDYAGAWIRREDYGKKTTYGWEVDHCKPLAKDGTYSPENLYPLHWENNNEKADGYPKWRTRKSSEGIDNINKIQNWNIKE